MTYKIKKSKPKAEKENKILRNYYIQGNYGQGWEDVNAEESYEKAKESLKEYDANESYPHRIKRGKEIK